MSFSKRIGFEDTDDNTVENLDTDENSKDFCPYCTHKVEKDGTTCDECQKWFHFKCLTKHHTWKGETIQFTTKFKSWLGQYAVDRGLDYSFSCSKCEPDAPPLLMQLWENKTLNREVACDLDVFYGPLEQYALEHPHDNTLSKHPDDKEDNASLSGISDVSHNAQPNPTVAQPDSTMKLIEMMMEERRQQADVIRRMMEERRQDKLELAEERRRAGAVEMERAERDERERAERAERDKRTEQLQTKVLESVLLAQSKVTKKEVTHLLPKLHMPTFSGKLTEWQAFWAAFSSCVDSNVDLPDSHKLQLLKSNLVGDAKNQIGGFSTTDAGYQKAKNYLLSTFGNTEAIIFEYVKILQNLPNSSEGFLKFFSEFNICIGNLLTLFNEDTEQLKMFLNSTTMSVFGKLSLPIQERLLRENGNQIKSDIVLLHSRLNQEAFIQRSLVKPNESPPGYSNRFRQQTKTSGAELLVSEGSTNQNRFKLVCAFCRGTHYSNKCSKFPTVATRKRQLGSDACTLCLRKGHDLSHCTLPKDSQVRECWHCKKRNDHNQAYCPTRYQKSELQQLTVELDDDTDSPVVPESRLTDSVEPIFLSPTNGAAAMPFIKAILRKPDTNICVEVNAFLDTGGKRTYLLDSVVDQLGLIRFSPQLINTVTFKAKKHRQIFSSSVNFEIRFSDGNFFEFCGNTTDSISEPFTVDAIPLSDHDREIISELNMASLIPEEPRMAQIDLLLGNDLEPYFHCNVPQKQLSSGVFLRKTRLGWYATGSHSSLANQSTIQPNAISPSFFSLSDSTSNFTLEDLFHLDNFGIRHDPKTTAADTAAIQDFDSSVQYHDGRCYVKWPWKDPNSSLPSNFNLCLRRLRSLLRSLQSKPDNLSERYNKNFVDQLHLGIIEKVEDTQQDGPRLHYIPHHAVITPLKTTTKLRVVFDASAKEEKMQMSLNESLYRGPVMLQDLCGLLLRFLTHKIALVSDIEKAFLQVALQLPDRDVTRFLWLKNPAHWTTVDNIQIYRFCRVPFGVISSPFLLGAAISWLLTHQPSVTADLIQQHTYVDNIITGVETLEQAKHFYTVAKDIFRFGSMNLREWLSNSRELMNFIPEADRVTSDWAKILGILWCVTSDTFHFKIPDKVTLLNINTKRGVLKTLAAIFDPLGWLSCIRIRGMIFLQASWKDNLDWDEPFSQSFHDSWAIVVKQIESIGNISIPRYFPCTEQTTLLCFCDASSEAYSITIYARVILPDTSVRTRLLFAKARVCPKTLASKSLATIPTLELKAVLTGVRCLSFILEQLHLQELKISQYLWTDSQCVLSWIESPKPVKAYIAKKIDEIRSHTSIQFRYVASKENPADLATRSSVLDLPEIWDFWFSGPKWIKTIIAEWPTWCRPPITAETVQQLNSVLRKNSPFFEISCLGIENQSIPKHWHISSILQPSNFSNLFRLYRVTGWIFRFVSNLKMRQSFSTVLPVTDVPSLTLKELRYTKLCWDKSIQRDAFPLFFSGRELDKKTHLSVERDTSGILRCHGRFKNACLPVNAMYPKLLPAGHRYTHLVIQAFHEMLCHVGSSHTLAAIRKEYWVIKGRSVVNYVLHRCSLCRLHRSYPYKPPDAPPLPSERVRSSPPFSFIGLDYFGPIYYKKFLDSRQVTRKLWVSLFTCMTIRAVHLEVVSDMTSDQFLLAFRRFVARRGKPIRIISDNSKTFKLAKKLLLDAQHADITEFADANGTDWQFIPEFAPWMGGFYERLIGITKSSLKKALGRALLTFPQITTVIIEMEGIVNSRPLCFVPSTGEGKIISPNDFLSLNPSSRLPIMESQDPTDPEYFPSCHQFKKFYYLGDMDNTTLMNYGDFGGINIF